MSCCNYVCRNMSRPLYEQAALKNLSPQACADDQSDHHGGVAPATLAETAESRALLEALPLGAPHGLASSQALYMCTNKDVLLGRADNGAPAV